MTRAQGALSGNGVVGGVIFLSICPFCVPSTFLTRLLLSSKFILTVEVLP